METFSKGQVIFKQGTWGMFMYVIKQGKVSIWADYGEPSQKMLTELGPGQYFGEMGLVASRLRSATAVADEDTELQVIGGKDLGMLLKEEPEKAVEMMRHLSARIRELTGQYMEVCRTVVELQDAENAGKEKSVGLMERVRNFAQFWRKHERA